MKEGNKAYFKCETSEGMFSDEYLTKTELYDGSTISGFFPKHLFKKEGLEVIVVSINLNHSKALIMIPHEGFITERPSKYILVNTNHLT